ncbi:hypothetical protein RRG08_035935 [Elysia crispata]|uniref:Uncharacterized protein n=1 Tax=Elysia crispata TaxID=231223 RepID=A0AAE1A1X3_9GAST|nr:hypothetical protein RRG08_035935 [Elysia crispata]
MLPYRCVMLAGLTHYRTLSMTLNVSLRRASSAPGQSESQDGDKSRLMPPSVWFLRGHDLLVSNAVTAHWRRSASDGERLIIRVIQAEGEVVWTGFDLRTKGGEADSGLGRTMTLSAPHTCK